MGYQKGKLPEKEILMDYVIEAKMMKISCFWRSKIAFLGNSKKGKFDGLCNNSKNDEIFFSLEEKNCLFRK